jgi:hypothetical protein
VRQLDNRALFELPEILADLLRAAAVPAAPHLASSTASLVA